MKWHFSSPFEQNIRFQEVSRKDIYSQFHQQFVSTIFAILIDRTVGLSYPMKLGCNEQNNQSYTTILLHKSTRL